MLPIIVGATIGLISIGAIRRYLQSGKKRLAGEQFALLGPSAAGKSTLASWLSTGQLPAVAVTTAKPEKMKGRTIDLAEVHMKILPITDVPGDIYARKDWQEQFSKATVACYLYDTTKIMKGDAKYADRVTRDMKHLGDWIQESGEWSPRFFLIGTHADLIKLAPTDDRPRAAAVLENNVVRRMINLGGGSGRVTPLVGSMADTEATAQLATIMLSRVVLK